MDTSILYRWSSIGRVLDPRYPTNRAVLILVPVAALVATIVALARGHEGLALAGPALGAAGTAFGSWALGRELAPEDNPAAFISMALAVAVYLWIAHTSVLLLILAVMLVRIVARPVGPPARVTDSIGVAALAGWVMLANRNPIPAILAALAFLLDAVLPPRLLRQWLFAGAVLGAAAYAIISSRLAAPGSAPEEPAWLPWVLLALAGIYIGMIVFRRRIDAVADLTGQPLDLDRVKAGLMVGVLVAVTGLVPIGEGLAQSALVWATLAGVVLGAILRRARSAVSS
jgi:hypothetical protein